MKIKLIKYSDTSSSYLYNCPGCGYEHAFGKERHQFNDDRNKPTVQPSLLNNFSPDRICHSFITNGQIQFLGDCWHDLKGQTVELPDYPEGTTDQDWTKENN